MYRQLEKFYVKYEHSDVSRYDKKYEKLGDWVGKQRKDYKNSEPRLTPVKIKKLTRLHFDWGISRTDWDIRFKELVAFKKRFEHTVVPHRWKENVPLSFWVKLQRQKKHNLPKDRLSKLNSIQFIWHVGYAKRKSYKIN